MAHSIFWNAIIVCRNRGRQTGVRAGYRLAQRSKHTSSLKLQLTKRISQRSDLGLSRENIIEIYQQRAADQRRLQFPEFILTCYSRLTDRPVSCIIQMTSVKQVCNKIKHTSELFSNK